ncbi:MAG: ANTAR domain-containing protein [Roseburia sp.]|nr:ANTAR domain-containing protein [Roseburia sp.]
MDALIVAGTVKQQHALTDVLYRADIDCVVCTTAAEARRAFLVRPFDVFVINSGLADEHGNELAVALAEANDCGGVFIDDFTRVDGISGELNDSGIVTLVRPITKTSLLEAVKLVAVSNVRVRRLKAKNDALTAKLEDMKYITRAKIVLMRSLGYTEEQAHKHIEKQSMDLRVSRRKVAMDILKTYEAI